MLGSIISTIGGLFGAKMNRDAAKDQQAAVERMNATKVQTTVKDARAAGIHPLAALGSPVAGSWATPVGQPGYGDAVADGAARLGSAIDNRGKDDLTQATIATERAKARNLDADTAAKLADAQRTTLSAAARRGGQSLDVAALGKPDPVQPITAFGRTFSRDPRKFSSAQVATDEFGEIADWVIGAPSLLEAATRDVMLRQDIIASIARSRNRAQRERVPPSGSWSVP